MAAYFDGKELAPAIHKHGVAMGYHICGNTMMLGTPDEVRDEVMRDIAACADSPNGYIVSTGCDIPVDAPVENIYAFMDAVREYGPTRLGEKK